MNLVKDLYNYRELLKTNIKKDVGGKYKNSVLGVLWSFINPLLQIAVYALVFQVILKSDIDNLKGDINLSDFVKKCRHMISEFNKDISYYNEPEVLGALKIMKRYEKKNETPYLVEEIIENDKKRFKIKEMYSEYINSINNIFNLGIVSCSSYTKDFGLQIFDPFDLMFSKDEKEKFGLN